jgi:hypothetical protein
LGVTLDLTSKSKNRKEHEEEGEANGVVEKEERKMRIFYFLSSLLSSFNTKVQFLIENNETAEKCFYFLLINLCIYL